MTKFAFNDFITACVKAREPFLFLIDFKCAYPFVCKLSEAAQNGFLYDVKGNRNFPINYDAIEQPELAIHKLDKQVYTKAFDNVLRNINEGNSYLLNLTFPTEIQSNLNLRQLFEVAKAPYKIYKEGSFVSFSPECFVRIKDGYIYAYPMKGTIDASIENAEQKLMENKKERWEHNTIVDLIRNDLSRVASEVRVTKFRYLEKIKTNRNEIYQTSSEIRGKLPSDWTENLGEILFKLLPAGSISGAPKAKTLEIIEEAEIAPRNYYTGIFGLFDGYSLDSAVCIRFIEQEGDKLFYKSGGGITFMSKVEEEYQEIIDKIYVPTF